MTRRVTDKNSTTLSDELTLICEKRQESITKFEAYSAKGHSISFETKLSLIEGQCVFLIDLTNNAVNVSLSDSSKKRRLPL